MALVARLNVTRQINQSDLNPVGMVAYADLTEAQFQALNGTGWVLADGRNVAGSTYATVTGNVTVSDLRGVTIRSKNNGRADGNQDPDGERALRSFQSHATAKNGLAVSDPGHEHITRTGLSPTYTAPNTNGVGGTGSAPDGVLTTPGANLLQSAPGATAGMRTNAPTTGISLGVGDLETRMRNVALNPFIKIN